MTRTSEPVAQGLLSVDPSTAGQYKNTPIIPSSTSTSLSPTCEPMEIVTPPATASMGPPMSVTPARRRSMVEGSAENANGTSSPGVGASAAIQQPKVVQTAFIHKLYNMLEDQTIQHLISWSNTNESFVMSPSSEFSKVLATYFKHTNISSFVRQLNMYGFHKVSDVFHNGSPDTPLWEFKHGNGNFKRGDLTGLREIKRRASRHALIHRDSFSAPKFPPVHAGPSPEPLTDPMEARVAGLEHSIYDMHSRLMRAEDNSALLSTKCQTLAEGLMRCHQWNLHLSSSLLAIVPDSESQLHRDVLTMGKDIERQIHILKSLEESQESLFAPRFSFFNNLPQEAIAPLSPRQGPQDDQRRSSLVGQSRRVFFKAPPPPHSSVSPRRFGSIGGSATSTLPSIRPPAPPAPALQLPSVSIQHLDAYGGPSPASLARRHTSADIGLHGWQGQSNSPYASGQSTVQWPSSPHRAPNDGDQDLRDALARYEFGRGPRSRQATPPLTNDTTRSNVGAENGWAIPDPRLALKGVDTPGPLTRRSSLASNVHSLLNPADTAERVDQVDQIWEDRKRKRVQ